MMMAADGYFIYNGREAVPAGVTRVRINESLTVIPAAAFYENPSIEELECHDRVKTVKEGAFCRCTSLRRVIMPGVEVVKIEAFAECFHLEDVECDKLEIIRCGAFFECKSLTCINLPSARVVEGWAFTDCTAMAKIKFSDKLESIGRGAFDGVGAFYHCTSLERITIPLKDGMITEDDTFQGCVNLKHVDLVEGEVHATIAYLQLEEWKNDMNEEINSINQILSNAPAGDANDDDDDDVGGKARAIRMWIRSVLGKIIRYKAQHQRALEEAAAVIQLQVALPQDIVMKNVIPFLELPSYTFEVGDHEDEEDDSDTEDDVDDYFDDDESSY